MATHLSQKWRLDGKVAVVTGGTKGIGFACAKELVELGAKVFICARTEPSVSEALKELNASPSESRGSAVGVVCDVSTTEGRSVLVQAVGSQLDCLVNNVGTNIRAKIEDATEEEYYKMMRTNVDSCFFLCKSFFPVLKECRGSSVVNVASVAGIKSSGTGSIYAATKGAMVQLTRALACEWASYPIRVNCVAPWMTMTPLLAEAVAKDPAQIEAATSWTPMKRLAGPEESAAAVAFLCLPASSYVTGQVLAVDGGISAQGFQGPCARE